MSPYELAENARLLLRNEVFLGAIGELEAQLVSSWKSSPPDKWKDRERIYDQLNALMDIKAKLEDYIHTAALNSTAIR